MKIAITAIVTCVLTSLLVGGLWVYSSKRSKGEPATPVRMEVPVRGEMIEVVSAPGEVEPMTKVSISARVSARIVELPCRAGRHVTKGDPDANPPVPPSVLVRLDDTDLKANLRSAKSRRDAQAAQITVSEARLAAQQSAIGAIRASHEDAVRNLDREKELFKSKVSSQAAMDQAQYQVDKCRADLTSAQHSLDADRKNLVAMRHTLDALDAEVARCQDSLTYTEITSPIDGIVTRVRAEVGEMVFMGTMNSPGTEIMQVADLDNMLVLAQVDENDIGRVKVGQAAMVRMQAYPDQVFPGAVHTVALVQNPAAFGRAKYYETRILLNSDGQRVLSGLTADVDIETQRHTAVLKVPSQAVLGRRVDDLPVGIRDSPDVDGAKAETPVVYRCIDGKAVVTPVRIGPVDATHSVISSGLCEADKVVLGPYKVLQSLKHDQKICDEPAAGTASKPATKPASRPTSRPAAP